MEEALGEIERQTRATVLFIEDEAIPAMDLESVVRDLGHDVACVATTHVEAVALARRTRPRLILADIALKDDSSGIDAVNEILAEMRTSVIFVTAFPERLLTGDRVQPTALITKPFRRSTLKATISQALFFDGDFATIDVQEASPATSRSGDLASGTRGDNADQAIAAASADLARADVAPLEAPVQVEVRGGRLVSTPGTTSAATIGAAGVEALRRQHHKTATRLA